MSNTATIKFPFTLSPNLYIDCSTVCFEFIIEGVSSVLKGNSLLLDGSSQSLISELKIESNST
jgi:hypothetical protein